MGAALPSLVLFAATSTTTLAGAETMAVRIIQVIVDAVWIVLVLMETDQVAN